MIAHSPCSSNSFETVIHSSPVARVCARMCVCARGGVYVCMCVCMYVCVYVSVCVYVCMYVYIHVCMYVYMYVCMYACM